LIYSSGNKSPSSLITDMPVSDAAVPFTTGVVLLASLAFLVGSVVSDWGNSWQSLLLLALSYPAYRLIIAARDRSGAR